MRISSKGLLTLRQTPGGQGPWLRRSGQRRTLMRKVIEAQCGVGMPRGKDLLPDLKRFLEKRFSFGVLAHTLVQRGQVIEAGRRVGMFWPNDLLPDLERRLVQ